MKNLFFAFCITFVSYTCVHALEIQGTTLELLLYFAAPFYTFFSISLITGIWWFIHRKVKGCPPPPTVDSTDGGVDVRSMTPQVSPGISFRKKEIIEDLLQGVGSDYQEKILWMIESLILFNNDINSVRTYSGLFIAFVRAYRDFSGKSVSGEVINFFARKCIPDTMVPQGDLTEESFTNFLRSSEDFKLRFKDFSSSPLFHQSGKLITLLVMVGLVKASDLEFSFYRFGKLEDKIKQYKLGSHTDLVYNVLDVTNFFLHTGYKLFRGDYHGVIFGSDEVQTFYAAHFKIKSDLTQYRGYKPDDFILLLNETIGLGEKLSYSHVSVRSSLLELQTIRAQIRTKTEAEKPRKAPLPFLLYSMPGQGKSLLTSMIYKTYSEVDPSAPFEEQTVYSRNPFDKFWSSFREGVSYITLDDIACINPKSKTPDVATSEIVQIVNDVVFCPPMADLEDKGTIPCRPKVVVGTTNIKTMNAHSYFSAPAAAIRRFPWVLTIKVNPEYMDSEGNIVQLSNPSLQCNVWLVKVQRVVLISTGESATWEYRNVVWEDKELVDVPFSTIQPWLVSVMKAHIRKGELKDLRDKHIHDTQLCEHNMFHLYCTDCKIMDEQGLISDLLPGQNLGHESYAFRISAWLLSKTVKLPTPLVELFSWDITPLRERLAANYLVYRFRRYMSPFDRNSTVRYHLEKIKRLKEGCDSRPIFCVVLLAVVVAAFQLYKLYKRMHPQGSIFSVGESLPENDEDQNVWTKNSIISEVPSPEGKGVNLAEGLDKLVKNVSHIRSEFVDSGKDKVAWVNCIPIGGTLYLIPKHSLSNLLKGKNTLMTLEKEFPFLVTKRVYVPIEGKDMALLNIVTSPPRPDLKKFFPLNPNGFRKTKGVIVFRHRLEPCDTLEIFNICYAAKVTNAEGGEPWHNVYTYSASAKPFKGLCGAPIVVSGPQGKGMILVGMHVAGESYDGLFEELNRALIDKAIDELSNVSAFASPQAGVFLGEGEFQKELTPQHPKSVFRYIQDHKTFVFGSFGNRKATLNSQVGPTIGRAIMDQLGFQCQHFRPNMKSWKPWRTGVLQAEDTSFFNYDLLESCADSYINRVTSRLSDFSEICIINRHTALNGHCGYKFIDSINRQTSSGFPYNKPKTDFLTDIGPTLENQNSVRLHQCIEDDCDRIMSLYKQGLRASPIFRASLKDEPVKERKIDATRVFMGAPFGFTVVMRQYLLMFTRFFQLNNFVFENAVGVNTEGAEWSDFHKYLTAYEGRNFGGDYSSFDKGQSCYTIMIAFRIIARICELSGNYSPEDIAVIRCIGTDIAFNYCEYNGDLVMFFGSMPSGHPLTVVVNCIVNSLYMRYAYASKGGNLNDFDKHVNLLTYGDDNICCVSPECLFFHHTAVQEVFRTVGINYTMPDKESESIPFSPLDDLDFLKRKFRRTKEWCYAPLDKNSLIKSLMIWTSSRTISPEFQYAQIIDSVLRYAFHHGEKTYKEYMKLALLLVTELNISNYLIFNCLPDYQYFYNVIVKSANSDDEKIALVARAQLRPEEYGLYKPKCSLRE